MTTLMKITAGTAVVIFLAFLMSCNKLSEDELNLENQRKGTVVFKITDAPFPVDLVEEANVTVDWIKLLKYPVEGMEEEEPAGDEVILIELEEALTFNLLELRNGLTATMAEKEIPAGVYAEIRLHVVDAEILLKDGNSFNLKVPSGDASGLKIKMEPGLEVLEGMQAEVLVDFDLSRSFTMQGNSKNVKGFIFKPVVRAVANVETATGEISGKVTGQDESPVGGASLALFQDEVGVTSAVSMDEDGFYSIIGVIPGTYELVLTFGEYTETVPVTVEAGETSVVDFVIGDVTGENTDGEAGEGETTGETGGDANGE